MSPDEGGKSRKLLAPDLRPDSLIYGLFLIYNVSLRRRTMSIFLILCSDSHWILARILHLRLVILGKPDHFVASRDDRWLGWNWQVSKTSLCWWSWEWDSPRSFTATRIYRFPLNSRWFYIAPIQHRSCPSSSHSVPHGVSHASCCLLFGLIVIRVHSILKRVKPSKLNQRCQVKGS
jgi:hypothetical protein